MGKKKGFNFGFFGFLILVLIAFNLAAFLTFFLRFNMLMTRPYERIKVKWTEESGEYVENLPTQVEGINFDMFIPAGLDKSSEQTLVMYIHGGNFSSGNRNDGVYLCEYLASKGCIAVEVDYSPINGENGMTIESVVDELYKTADSVVKSCEERGYKIKNMAVSGVYGGGTLAILYATMHPEKSPVPVELVFEQTGPTSFDPKAWGFEGEDAVNMVNIMTGSSFTVDDMESDEFKAAYQKISPDEYISGDSVPVILGHGAKDKIVPAMMVIDYSGKLKKAGGDCVMVEYTKSGHILALDKDKNDEFYDAVDSYLEKLMVK